MKCAKRKKPLKKMNNNNNEIGGKTSSNSKNTAQTNIRRNNQGDEQHQQLRPARPSRRDQSMASETRPGTFRAVSPALSTASNCSGSSSSDHKDRQSLKTRRSARPLKKRPVDASLFDRPTTTNNEGPQEPKTPTSPLSQQAAVASVSGLSLKAHLEQQIKKQKRELEMTQQMMEQQQQLHQQLLQLKNPDQSLESLANRYRFETAPTTRTVVTAAMQALLQSTNASPLQLMGGLGINVSPQQQQQQNAGLSHSALRDQFQASSNPGTTGHLHNDRNVMNALQASRFSMGGARPDFGVTARGILMQNAAAGGAAAMGMHGNAGNRVSTNNTRAATSA